MESVAAHKDETPVESKIDDLKRKSVDAKDVADHGAKNVYDQTFHDPRFLGGRSLGPERFCGITLICH
ncbi:unnamed protein product [Heterobilharzia americana]|nr:unnamed protein product [Heterobilharzia americana]